MEDHTLNFVCMVVFKLLSEPKKFCFEFLASVRRLRWTSKSCFLYFGDFLNCVIKSNKEKKQQKPPAFLTASCVQKSNKNH